MDAGAGGTSQPSRDRFKVNTRFASASREKKGYEKPLPEVLSHRRQHATMGQRGNCGRADQMRTSFAVDDMTIHRIVEQEHGFTPILEFLPSLSKELLDENRSWMEPAAL